MLLRHSMYAVQMSSYFLRPIGLWPLSQNASVWHKLFNFLRVGLSYWLMIFVLVPCALYTFLEEQNITIKIKLIGPMSFALMALAKYSSLFQSTAEIANCFHHVEEDWQRSCNVEKKVMYKHAKVGRSLSTISAIFMYGGGILYHGIIPIIVSQALSTATNPNDYNSMKFNTTNNITILELKKIRILSFPIYNAWINLDIDFIFATVYLLQLMAGYVLDTITVGTCSLAATFVTHTCSQLELVIMLIKKYIDGDTDEDDVPFPQNAKTRVTRLAVIVKRHIRALQFTDRVEKYLNGIFFVEFIGCTWNLCAIGYYCLIEWERRELISTATYIILLTSFAINIFVFCYIGELLNEQYTRIGLIYYVTDWYNLPGKSASDLFFIMAISQYPKKLTAGKFVDLTLITFSTIVKSAFTYFNLLRTIVA